MTLSTQYINSVCASLGRSSMSTSSPLFLWCLHTIITRCKSSVCVSKPFQTRQLLQNKFERRRPEVHRLFRYRSHAAWFGIHGRATRGLGNSRRPLLYGQHRHRANGLQCRGQGPNVAHFKRLVVGCLLAANAFNRGLGTAEHCGGRSNRSKFSADDNKHKTLDSFRWTLQFAFARNVKNKKAIRTLIIPSSASLLVADKN